MTTAIYTSRVDGKNVLISSFGRNISPEWVEAQLSTQPIIYQVAVLGDGEPHLSAVIVANPNMVATSNDPQSAIAQAIDVVNQTLPDYARIQTVASRRAPF